MTAIKGLILLLVGVFIGGVLTFSVVSTLERRSAIPVSNMRLQEYHLAQTRKAARSNACVPADAAAHLRRVRDLSLDADAIFATAGYDSAEFTRRRQALSVEIEAGLIKGADCETIGIALKNIADSCENCHHEMR